MYFDDVCDRCCYVTCVYIKVCRNMSMCFNKFQRIHSSGAKNVVEWGTMARDTLSQA
jgi:hypothetical protein